MPDAGHVIHLLVARILSNKAIKEVYRRLRLGSCYDVIITNKTRGLSCFGRIEGGERYGRQLYFEVCTAEKTTG